MNDSINLYNTFTWRYLIQSLDVPAASVCRRANVLQWRVEMREVVGQVEGGRQEPGDKHLTDLDRRSNVT